MKVYWRRCAGLLSSLAVACVLLLPARPAAAINIDVRIDASGVPQFLFDSEPRLVVVGNSQTYYAQDVSTADIYRLNGAWYAYYQDNWYRSSNYRSPWVRTNPDGIPQELWQVPNGFSRFPRSSRGDSRRDPDNRPDARDNRNSNDGFGRGPAGDYVRNSDGTYTWNPDGGYVRNSDGTYTRDPNAGYTRDADGRYTRRSGDTYTRNADGSYTRISNRGYGRGSRFREPDGSVIQISAAPRMYPMRRTNIFYARNYRDGDLYRSGSRWYIYYDGNWFASNSYSGPWRYIETSRVPSRVVNPPRGFYHTTRVTTTRTYTSSNTRP